MDTLRISQFGFLIYAPFIKSSRLSLLGLLFKLNKIMFQYYQVKEEIKLRLFIIIMFVLVVRSFS